MQIETTSVHYTLRLVRLCLFVTFDLAILLILFRCLFLIFFQAGESCWLAVSSSSLRIPKEEE